jgi:cell wall-associated NlpC family hydrolase
VKALAALGAACASTALVAPALDAAPASSWALPQIKVVTSLGIFTATPETFRADDPLTAGTLARIVASVRREPAAQPATPSAPVSITALDAALVRGFGLGDAATRFADAVRLADLDPPSRFGTEVVARTLGLRVDHPAAADALELQPQETATRAEAAFSTARAVALKPADLQAVRAAASALALPALTPWQRRVLAAAVSLVGYPYVWGGDDERTERGLDCSGLVLRAYALAAGPETTWLPTVLQGRTTYEMSGIVPRALRIAWDDLRPADVLFFGRGPASKPTEVTHTGLYLGNGWMIDASTRGVSLSQLGAWYRDRFAWARRPLAEAGLE